MSRKDPTRLPERTETFRQAILRELQAGPATAHELSALVGLREREVIPHLEHLERSLRRSDRRLRMTPAECLECGFVFRKRSRLSRPGACPICRSRRIEAPRFSIEGA
jgi:predicted Zn-ribbon and HTH transcriptional regulator